METRWEKFHRERFEKWYKENFNEDLPLDPEVRDFFTVVRNYEIMQEALKN